MLVFRLCPGRFRSVGSSVNRLSIQLRRNRSVPQGSFRHVAVVGLPIEYPSNRLRAAGGYRAAQRPRWGRGRGGVYLEPIGPRSGRGGMYLQPMGPRSGRAGCCLSRTVGW